MHCFFYFWIEQKGKREIEAILSRMAFHFDVNLNISKYPFHKGEDEGV
ncbi:hypothetical protein PMI05_01148 [Brevibacillus sp. BC25]|nr:hypothetical protein PMI05_01148 [Brevibacillus sp. BC25]